jgi:hypothetical protein
VEERPESIRTAAGPLDDDVRDERSVLCDRVIDPAVPAEAALVRQRAGDVVELDLVDVRV